MNISEVITSTENLTALGALFVICLAALGLVWRALGLIGRDKDGK